MIINLIIILLVLYLIGLGFLLGNYYAFVNPVLVDDDESHQFWQIFTALISPILAIVTLIFWLIEQIKEIFE